MTPHEQYDVACFECDEQMPPALACTVNGRYYCGDCVMGHIDDPRPPGEFAHRFRDDGWPR